MKFPTSGSRVDHPVAPFAEPTLIHSGPQSMPLAYDDTHATYSEAKNLKRPVWQMLWICTAG